MSLRRAIVVADLDGLNVAEFCRVHGVSTWFFWDLRRRYQAEGEAALEPRSRAPRRVANRTPLEVEDRIVGWRKELVELGLDAGPATIAVHLRNQGLVPTPSEATIWRVLVRRGFVTADPSKAPKHAHRSFAAERANECWQIDDTTWTLANGAEVKIIDIVDDCTRVLVASRAVVSCTGEAAFDAFCAAGTEWGLPARFLSDNAKAFRRTLARTLAALGIAAGHSRPYHPQTCGKVERLHLTVKRFLAAQPRAETLDELQDQLDRFRVIYNHDRPHRSLDRRTPASVWATTPRSGPADTPLTATTQIRHLLVNTNGTIDVTRYQISLGAAHAHNRATVITTGLACHVFIDGRLVRQLTIDPTRRSQPLYNRPGRPPTVRDVPRQP